MVRWSFILLASAGLLGAGGVIAAAAAAHGTGGHNLETASTFALLHAAAVIGIAAVTLGPTRGKPLFLSAATILLAGGVLFCGDLALRALTGQRLFPMAAPTGGTMLILGWLVFALSAAAVAFITQGKR